MRDEDRLLTICAIYGTLCRDAFSLSLWKTPQFQSWYDSLEEIDRAKIDGRLENLAQAHFGDSRSLGGSLFELKWKNGMRVYYTRRRIKGIDAIVLWGGFKGTQRLDIEKSRRLKTLYERTLENDGEAA